ncbi:MAG: mechanosensitive ion channel family protein [Bacteroidales bacterium]|jgi:MscS family membrane protein|nr:mechanosensitive ion channel family protein [Bacteroidales bacterium]
MLEKEFYGNTFETWLISLAIIIIAVIICKLISLLNKRVIRKITARTNNKYDDILFQTLESPFLFGIMLFAIWIAISNLSLGDGAKPVITKAYHILAVLNATWFLSKFAGAIIEEQERKNREKHNENNKLIPIVKRAVVSLIWIIGIVTALNNAGVNVATLLGTLGIGGIAFALAAQDTIKNMIGGMTLFSDRPFRIGDRIKFDSIDGNVEDIGLRSTRIRTLDKRIITIPNYKIVDAAIENITGEPRRRVVVKLSLTYSTTPGKMKEALDILKLMPKIIKEVDTKDIAADFTDFGDSALVITYIYFIKKSSPNIVSTTSQVNTEILTRFNNAGIEFAFPSQTIYFDKKSFNLNAGTKAGDEDANDRVYKEDNDTK